MRTAVCLFIAVTSVLFCSTSGICMETISFEPVNHATFVIRLPDYTIYVDPVGSRQAFSTFPAPDLILVTHTHGDHLDAGLIGQLKQEKTIIIGPQSVIDQLKYGRLLSNGETVMVDGVRIEAVPMYNMTPERMMFHPKGNGNGYLLTVDGKRVYISGDTEDIPEMRQLKNIDYAFICINLPYTMTEDQAASAVLEMAPGTVFPYHFRGKGGFSDLDRFTALVGKNEKIIVKRLNWYDK